MRHLKGFAGYNAREKLAYMLNTNPNVTIRFSCFYTLVMQHTAHCPIIRINLN